MNKPFLFQQGSSFIETLVASTLISFICVFAFHSHAMILLHSTAEQVKTQSQFLARELTAQLRPFNHDTIERVLPTLFGIQTKLPPVACATLSTLECEQAEQLRTELMQWQQRFAKQLNNARFELTRSEQSTALSVYWPKIANSQNQPALVVWEL